MVVQVFKEITQPNMENTFLNAVKAKQIKNTDIEDLIEFRNFADIICSGQQWVQSNK